jgi:hypothetical protein
MPGKSQGEKIPDAEIKNFLALNKIPNWRKKLSNDWVEPFIYDNHKWASVSHLFEASKYHYQSLPNYLHFQPIVLYPFYKYLIFYLNHLKLKIFFIKISF